MTQALKKSNFNTCTLGRGPRSPPYLDTSAIGALSPYTPQCWVTVCWSQHPFQQTCAVYLKCISSLGCLSPFLQIGVLRSDISNHNSLAWFAHFWLTPSTPSLANQVNLPCSSPRNHPLHVYHQRKHSSHVKVHCIPQTHINRCATGPEHNQWKPEIPGFSKFWVPPRSPRSQTRLNFGNPKFITIKTRPGRGLTIWRRAPVLIRHMRRPTQSTVIPRADPITPG